jgi:signal peptidase I
MQLQKSPNCRLSANNKRDIAMNQTSPGTVNMNWTPRPWIAVVLSLLAQPLGLLYAGSSAWAAGYFVLSGAFALVGFLNLLPAPIAPFWSLLSWVLVICGAVLAYRLAKIFTPATQPWYARWYGLVSVGVLILILIVGVRTFLYEPFKAPSTSMAPGLERGAHVIVQKHGYGHLSAFSVKFGSMPITAPIQRGDVIVFDYPRDPSQSYIKRVVGVPGDRVELRDRRLFVNGKDTRGRELDGYMDPEVPRMSKRYRSKLDDTEFDTLLDDEQSLDHDPRAPFDNFAFRDRCVIGNGELSCEVPPGNYFVLGDNRDNSADSRYWGFVPSKGIIGKVVKVFPQP